MPSWRAHSLPDHCTPQDDFLNDISSIFGTCVPTYPGLISIFFGNLSIAAWLFAQLPQVIKNYKLQSTAGLSISFLIEWCLGDSTNLVGGILTSQATWQITLACYYTTIDIVLVMQYFYYTRLKSKEQEKIFAVTQLEDDGYDDDRQDGFFVDGSGRNSRSNSQGQQVDDEAQAKSRKAPFDIFKFPSSSSSSPREKSTPESGRKWIHRTGQHENSPTPSPKTLIFLVTMCAVLTNATPTSRSRNIHTLETGSDSQAKAIAGLLISWCSTLLYLASRLPQLYKNHVRRSTSGLSPALFAAAFTGNLFYSVSMLTNPLAWASYPPYGLHGWVGAEGSEQRTWVASAAPFFLGAAGVLALDAAIGVQFLYFGEGREADALVKVRDGKGKGHWRKVSGWMRGWIPTPNGSLERVVEEDASDERPLLERDSLEDMRRHRNYGGT